MEQKAPANTARAAAQGNHLLGISLEDYFHVGAFRQLISEHTWTRFESRLEHAARVTLDLLDAHGAHATFFTLGWVAERMPELLATIRDRGHEIANSGYAHRTIDRLDATSLRCELLRGQEAIERAIGVTPRGVRIPGFLRERDRWALDVVADLGFAYDASFRPLGTDCSETPADRLPFVHRHRDHELLEFPVPTTRIGRWLLPIGGGNWIRQLPESFIRRAVTDWQEAHNVPFSFYFHVWELDPEQPRITAASRVAALRHYRNLDQSRRLLSHFLATLPFTGYAARLGLAEHPAASTVVATASLPPEVGGRNDPSPARTGVTVAVPCFNEADSLPFLLNTLDDVRQQLAARYRLSFVLVDDGSSDDTWRVMQSLVGPRSDFQLVRHERNHGIARAIMTGIAAARDEFVCSIDADCTYDPHQIALLLPALADGADLVTASPYHPEGQVRHVPEWRLTLSRTLSWMYRWRVGCELYTWTSCFRAYRRSRFVGTPLTHAGFLGIAEMLIRAVLAGTRVEEVPATLEVRLLGHSKLKVFRVIMGHLRLLRQLGVWRVEASAIGRVGRVSAEHVGAS